MSSDQPHIMCCCPEKELDAESNKLHAPYSLPHLLRGCSVSVLHLPPKPQERGPTAQPGPPLQQKLRPRAEAHPFGPLLTWAESPWCQSAPSCTRISSLKIPCPPPARIEATMPSEGLSAPPPHNHSCSLMFSFSERGLLSPQEAGVGPEFCISNKPL